ncbi:MAG: hypothetical protein AAGH76_06280 [Pseudomonadota bacterium]
MIARSIVAVLLSIPASMILISLFLAATPPITALRAPSMLLVFPLWVVIATASFLVPTARFSALMLSAISLVGYGLIQLLDAVGVGGA